MEHERKISRYTWSQIIQRQNPLISNKLEFTHLLTKFDMNWHSSFCITRQVSYSAILLTLCSSGLWHLEIRGCPKWQHPKYCGVGTEQRMYLLTPPWKDTPLYASQSLVFFSKSQGTTTCSLLPSFSTFILSLRICYCKYNCRDQERSYILSIHLCYRYIFLKHVSFYFYFKMFASIFSQKPRTFIFKALFGSFCPRINNNNNK